MKITAVCNHLTRSAGGIFESVRQLSEAMTQLPGVETTACGVADEFSDADLPAWTPTPVKVFPSCGPRQFLYAPQLRRYLLASDADTLHRHGLWTHPSADVSAWHREFRRPYVVSPHGMLDPWAVKNSGWKKRLAWLCYEREHLENAGCLRALCAAEANSMREFGLKNPICIIPNGVNLPPPPDPGSRADFESPLREAARGRQVLLYLGRLHPKKGLTPLLLAWKKVREEHPAQAASWVLAIAGWDQGGHESQLRRLGDEIGLGDAIVFPGPQFGEAREGCYRGCAAFVLPSLSEGLPMVVLEAWSHGKPVLMTPECNLPEGFNADAAIEIEPTPEAIAPGLVRMLEMSGNERLAMGGRGLALVKERFVWQKVAGQMRAVHDWMLGGGDCPESVATMENSPR